MFTESNTRVETGKKSRIRGQLTNKPKVTFWQEYFNLFNGLMKNK